MNLIVTGRGTSGSWHVRGEQLGKAIGATVEPRVKNVQAFDTAIIVKRYTVELYALLKWARIPVVYDIVDAYPQPLGNDWAEKDCKDWLRRQIDILKPRALVAATQAMARDCEFGLPVLALPHHARPGDRVNPIREKVQKVGYQGATHYLGHWGDLIERECRRRGWVFVMNPAELADVDIAIALRAQDGYAPRHWKSNVKLANAQGSGTPVICSPEAGYKETACGVEEFVDSPQELGAAFDKLEPQAYRRMVSERMASAAPRLEDIAETYREWLTKTI